ncbi:MAG TPA: 1-deoxy-D-xylulose-5-phosphate reductoisomerase [Acidimicrobiales bacterium]|nr:1-deoxy-D-xylulose-5-phosphate reductoisomerase [Acidimicrobiales bacterium]
MAPSLAILGATGSIGTQALDVLSSHPDAFELDAISAWRNLDLLASQARTHRPRRVVVADPDAARSIAASLPEGTGVLVGHDGLVEAASTADVVLNAVVGFAGVPVTLAALAAGRRLALANKESLIVAAPLVAAVRSTRGAQLLPVDSEHCAIHQCLAGLRGDAPMRSVRRLILTASGGPFRGRRHDELATVSVDDALDHPTWRMGAKVTIDSSTLMNKGLEVLEASALFGVEADRVDVVVHPQSIVHSMVELVDGSTIAQLSLPDMRLPIAYALGYPDRFDDGYGRLAFDAPLTLSFEPPDTVAFPCLSLAYDAGRLGGTAPAWLNAADEVAVDAFLSGGLSWQGIARVVGETLARYDGAACSDIEALLRADTTARGVAAGIMESMAAGVHR